MISEGVSSYSGGCLSSAGAITALSSTPARSAKAAVHEVDATAVWAVLSIEACAESPDSDEARTAVISIKNFFIIFFPFCAESEYI